jgi:O-antigen/teichoic acid export membrane protein
MAAMSDTTPNTPPPDWRDTRRRERYERRRDRFERRPWGPGGSWIAGLILIALGAIFLAQNFGYPVPHNWWAIFILLPAFAAFAAAWSMYQQNGGEMSPPVTSALITGLLLTGLAVIFLLGVDLSKFWPVILIVLGVGALLGGGRWRQNRPPP